MAWKIEYGQDGKCYLVDALGRERALILPTGKRNYDHDADEIFDDIKSTDQLVEALDKIADLETCLESMTYERDEAQQEVADLEKKVAGLEEYEEKNTELTNTLDAVRETNEDLRVELAAYRRRCESLSDDLAVSIEELNKLLRLDHRILPTARGPIALGATHVLPVRSVEPRPAPKITIRKRSLPSINNASDVGGLVWPYTQSLVAQVGDRVLINGPYAQDMRFPKPRYNCRVTGIVLDCWLDRSYTVTLAREDGQSGAATDRRYRYYTEIQERTGWWCGFEAEKVTVLERPARAPVGEYVRGTYGEMSLYE